MPAPTSSQTFFGFGARRAWVYALNSDMTPAATSTSPYIGIEMRGFTGFEMTVPENRVITGLDRDGISQVVSLPPTDGPTGSFSVDGTNPSILQIATGLIPYTEGEAVRSVLVNSTQGYEPLVGLIVQQEGRIIETGAVVYRTIVFPAAQLLPRPGSFGGDKSTMTYQVIPSRVSRNITGQAFTVANDGVTEGHMIEYFTEGRLMFQSWLADGTETQFAFHSSYPAIGADKVALYANGTAVSAGITVATSGITYGTAPADATRLVAKMEY